MEEAQQFDPEESDNEVNFSDDPMIAKQFDSEESDNEEDFPSDFVKLYLEPPYDG